ncbi:MAG: hypothetical protein FJ293_05640 [Planctomycetes bacterium]|nr:hypothetical protein [Planctomycetota bacterium]
MSTLSYMLSFGFSQFIRRRATLDVPWRESPPPERIPPPRAAPPPPPPHQPPFRSGMSASAASADIATPSIRLRMVNSPGPG